MERRLRPRRDAKGECGDVVGMHHPRNKRQLEIHKNSIVTLPETNIFAPENGWLEYDPFLLGYLGLFSGAFAVSFREGRKDRKFLFLFPSF